MGTFRSLVDGTIRFQVDISPVDQKEFMQLYEIGSAIAIARLQGESALPDAIEQVEDKQVETGDYGAIATVLSQAEFWLNINVLEAIGTDDDFLDYIRSRKDCAFKPRSNNNFTDPCEDDVIAAHVRRVKWGAGTGIKPKYAAIPCCFKHHDLQHQHGESYVAPQYVWEAKRNYYVSKWSWTKIKENIGIQSFSTAHPRILVEWARERELLHLLPAAYINAANQ